MTSSKMLELNKIHQGDCLKLLKALPDESINCVVTSPPYWALRDYGVEGQLGLEPTFQEYINKLCDIFDEVKRVLRKDGTCWVNLGDTYWGGCGGPQSWEREERDIKWSEKSLKNPHRKDGTAYPDKSLCCIPDRFKIEMINRGWICRNEIIWFKPNCMPSSAKDRFTVDYEKVFFFVKNQKYWFETQYEAYTEPMNRWGGDKLEAKGKSTWDEGTDQNTYRDRNMRPNPQGRNKRCVWQVTTKPFKEAHFATYPEELIEPMIKAGCPEFVCNKCGKAREKIIEKDGRIRQHWAPGTDKKTEMAKGKHGVTSTLVTGYKNVYKEIGLTDCGCNTGFTGGIVLDPFFGSGTTGLVALKQNKKFIGMELNQEYINIATKRLKPILSQKKIFDQEGGSEHIHSVSL